MEPPLASLFPDQGLRRGSVLGISGSSGVLSLLLATLARPLHEGSWAAVVGIPELGAEAAAALGVRLDRLALVPDPGPRWPEVVSALLDALDLVVVGPPGRCRPADARRLAARVRERRRVLVVLAPREAAVLGGDTGGRDLRSGGLARWPESVDLQLEVVSSRWHGLDGGDGVLQSRQVTVRSSGRRSGARERAARLWLPGPGGRLAPVDTPAADGPAAQGPARGQPAGWQRKRRADEDAAVPLPAGGVLVG